MYRDWPSVGCTAVSATIRAEAAPVAVDRLPPSEYLPARGGVISHRITATLTVKKRKKPTSNAPDCGSQRRFLSLPDYSGRLFQFGPEGGGEVGGVNQSGSSTDLVATLNVARVQPAGPHARHGGVSHICFNIQEQKMSNEISRWRISK